MPFPQNKVFHKQVKDISCYLGLVGQSAGPTHKGRAERELKELCSPGIPSWILKKLLPGEGCAIWFCCAEVYIISLSHIFYQDLQSHRIWALQPPARDWTRKMLYQHLSPGDFGKVRLHNVQNGDTSGRYVLREAL